MCTNELTPLRESKISSSSRLVVAKINKNPRVPSPIGFRESLKKAYAVCLSLNSTLKEPFLVVALFSGWGILAFG